MIGYFDRGMLLFPHYFTESRHETVISKMREKMMREMNVNIVKLLDCSIVYIASLTNLSF